MSISIVEQASSLLTDTAGEQAGSLLHNRSGEKK